LPIIVIVADVDEGRAKAIATKIGCPATMDWQEVVSRDDLDVVVVATPSRCHYDRNRNMKRTEYTLRCGLDGLWIRLSSPGPALHCAPRVGAGGKLFALYKFRSMMVNAAEQSTGVTLKDDHRITLVGKWLRRTKIDELPQLINVLKGEMSLVGSRAEDPRFVARYTPEPRAVLRVETTWVTSD
jgi:hypothetical protein